MKRFFLALLFLVLFVTPAPADYILGGDGYYHLNGRRFTRVAVQAPGYWSCNRYVPGAVSYQYTEYVAPVVVTPHAAIYNDEAQLLKLVAAREKHNQFLEKAKALGLIVSYQGQGTVPYGVLPNQQLSVSPYALSGSSYQNFGVQANTQYGYNNYSYQSLASLYAPNDLNALYQSAAQLTLNAQKLSGEANGGFQSLVGAEGQSRARVAEILAKRDLAIAVLNAVQNAPSSSGFSFRIEPTGLVRDASKATPEAKERLANIRNASAQARCVACHNAAVKKGGFDVATYDSLPPEDKQVVLARITSSDVKTKMPRKLGPDGKAPPTDLGPGEPILGEELLSWSIESQAVAPPAPK